MSFFPSSNAAQVNQQAAVNLDFPAVMRQVYLWLFLGLAVGFGVAFLIGNVALSTLNGAIAANDPSILSSSVLFNPVVMIVSLIGYIILAFALQPIIMRSSPAVGGTFYLLFTALFGFMISTIFLQYTPGTIAMAFVATAGMFGVMSVYGFVTKADLSKLGSILLMAIIGLFIASIVNIFAQSQAIYWLISYAGVLIFAGLTAYDTQWIKNNAARVAMSGDNNLIQRIALIGAFHLFMDFVNLFLFLLRIFGGRSGGSRRF